MGGPRAEVRSQEVEKDEVRDAPNSCDSIDNNYLGRVHHSYRVTSPRLDKSFNWPSVRYRGECGLARVITDDRFNNIATKDN